MCCQFCSTSNFIVINFKTQKGDFSGHCSPIYICKCIRNVPSDDVMGSASFIEGNGAVRLHENSSIIFFRQ